MDKRQRLRFNSPDNSFDIRTDRSNIGQDSTIIIPKGPDAFEASEQMNPNIDISNFESSFGDDLSISVQNVTYSKADPWKFILKYKNYASYAILTALILYFALQSNDYKFLLEEVEKLRLQTVNITVNTKLDNIACLLEGSRITEHSDLYKFGLLRYQATDKNSILESGMSNLALKSNNGFFDILIKPNSKISKIALYHPEIGNPESAIKDFSLLINNKKFDFQFSGEGYQEFSFETQKTSSLRIEFYNNHGEDRYTCIYRIYVFSQ